MGRWTKERHAQEAAKKADVAARAHQASTKTAAAEPDVPPPAETVEPPASDFQFISPRDNPRDLAMEEIITRHESGASPEPELEAPKLEPEPPKPSEVPIGPETVVEEPVKIARVKVDGEELDVPQSDVDAAGGIHAYQRDRAAENRLRKANEVLAETRRTQVATAEWLQKLIQAQPSAESAQTEDQFIGSKMDTIRFGTPEESAAALREVTQRINPRVDTSTIIQQAATHVKYDMARAKFVTDYQDIFANPLLAKLERVIEAERVAQFVENGQVKWGEFGNIDFNNFFVTIGNQVRSVIGRPSQLAVAPAVVAASEVAASASAPSSPSQSSDKVARKASIVTLPTAAARAELPQEAKPESREDIITHMRKSRGLPTD